MNTEMRLDLISMRALKLTEKYLMKAVFTNKPIADIIENYKVAVNLSEGAFYKKGTRPTIFGSLLAKQEIARETRAIFL